jgi:Kef-type K+ transport system membrane component KefB
LKQLTVQPISIIIGMGPGAGWGKAYPMHNEWLQCLHQFGLIGLSLMVGFAATISRGNRVLFTAFLIAAVNMFGNYSLHLAPSAFLICVIAGLIEREKLA